MLPIILFDIIISNNIIGSININHYRITIFFPAFLVRNHKLIFSIRINTIKVITIILVTKYDKIPASGMVALLQFFVLHLIHGMDIK